MKLAVIAGDGIGPEVIGEALKVLDAVLPGVERTEYDLGARCYHATGEALPDGVVDVTLRIAAAIATELDAAEWMACSAVRLVLIDQGVYELQVRT